MWPIKCFCWHLLQSMIAVSFVPIWISTKGYLSMQNCLSHSKHVPYPENSAFAKRLIIQAYSMITSAHICTFFCFFVYIKLLISLRLMRMSFKRGYYFLYLLIHIYYLNTNIGFLSWKVLPPPFCFYLHVSLGIPVSIL